NDAIDSTVPIKKAKPNAQKRKEAQKKKVELEAALIASHRDKDSPQNFRKGVTSNLITSDVQTPGKRQIIPEIQEDIDEADYFTYDHPHDATSSQNNSDDQVSGRFHSIIEREEDPEVEDHFIYGSRDFEADEYRQVILEDDSDYDSKEEPRNTTDDTYAMHLLQTFGATTHMSEVQVKEVTDRQGLSLRGESHFSPGFVT
ncbi:hypothetical protein HAX54_001219, partial [Datura stramonium]|nr:hypothetical protein [Datura stramonium]